MMLARRSTVEIATIVDTIGLVLAVVCRILLIFRTEMERSWS